MAGKKTFSGLLPEIKTLVIEHILRPTDLQHVCLVNKELHELAVRSLYRSVSLDLGSAADNRLSAFLNPKNIGLKHIRTLRLNFTPHTSGKKTNLKQLVHFAIRMLLEFLPEDVLEVVSWCPWESFNADNLLLLYKKQRRMKSLEVMNLDRDILHELKKSPKLQGNLFSHARKLLLYPEDRDTLARGGFFVEKTAANLEELLIHAHFQDPHDIPELGLHVAGGIDSRELNDSATAPGLLSRVTFAHMMPFETCTHFPKLKSLRLHRISVRHCQDTWCKIVDFTNLQDLRLDQCPGADSLLGQLCKAKYLPKQLRTLEFQHKDNEEDEALVALDGFLCLVSGLEELHVDIEHVKALPGSASIARHGKTLEVLNVHCSQGSGQGGSSSDGSSEELVWDSEDIERICKACTGLEQLSCAWPATSLIRRPGDEWIHYEDTVGSLKNLVTLNITTLPHNKPSSQPLPRQVYEILLQALAQRIFEPYQLPPPPPPSSMATPPPPLLDPAIDLDDIEIIEVPDFSNRKLRLLAFGFSDKIYERQDSNNQLIYLRSTCQDAFGKTHPYAAKIGWCHRQFEEPRSDVLDFVLHRDNKPLWRDREGLGWGDDDESVDYV